MCRLLDLGIDAIGIDNYDPYYDVGLKHANARLVGLSGGEIVELDIRDADAVSAIVRDLRPDAVLHLAAKAGVRQSLVHPAEFFEVNLLGTLNIFEALRELPTARVVMGSTSSVYGNATEVPFTEATPADHPPQPYASSKRAAELLAQTYHDTFGIQTTVTRFFTVYGPRGRPDMMPMLLLHSIDEGREIPLFGVDLQRDWTFIDDICAGLEVALHRPLGFEIVNLGRGEPVRLGDFIAETERVRGRTANLVPSTPPASEMAITFADIGKARRLLDYSPTVSFDDGIARLSSWYDQR
jgi:UDP-glucuronate 4-epimerase